MATSPTRQWSTRGEVLANPHLAYEMVELNYRLARRHFSYSVLRRRLHTLITEFLGEDDADDWSTP